MFLFYYRPTHFKQDSFILSFWSIEEYSRPVVSKVQPGGHMRPSASFLNCTIKRPAARSNSKKLYFKVWFVMDALFIVTYLILKVSKKGYFVVLFTLYVWLHLVMWVICVLFRDKWDINYCWQFNQIVSLRCIAYYDFVTLRLKVHFVWRCSRPLGVLL
jgi:hypothetical protein